MNDLKSRIRISLLVAFLFFNVFSCKKEKSQEKPKTEEIQLSNTHNNTSLKFVQSLINDFNRRQFTHENLQMNVDSTKGDYKLFWKIKWDVNFEKLRKDSVDYVYIPINAYFTERGVKKQAAIINYKKYLVIAITPKKKMYYLAYTFPDEDKSLPYDSSFSGSIAFKSLDNQKYFRKTYQAGVISNEPTANSTISSTSSSACTDTYLCSWNFTCFNGGSGFVSVLGKVSVGGCVTPTYQEINQNSQCPSYSQPFLSSTQLISHVCPPDVPDPNPLPPIPPPGGSGGGIGNGFSPSNVLNGNGTRPISESPDKCTGAVSLWNLSVSNNKETVGLLAEDGKFLTIAILNANGGSFGGLYNYGGKTYYTYPASQGAPTQNYGGMIQSNGQYFIPLKATVHTHVPCMTDGTNGISNMTLSSGDQALANNFTLIKHYIVGCNAIGSFSHSSTSPLLIKSGVLSSTCSSIN